MTGASKLAFTLLLPVSLPLSAAVAQDGGATDGSPNTGAAGGALGQGADVRFGGTPGSIGGPDLGMGAFGQTSAQMAATGRHVYVLRGGHLSAFDARTMQLTGTAVLATPGGGGGAGGALSGAGGVGGGAGGIGGGAAGAGSGLSGGAAGNQGGSIGAGAAGGTRAGRATNRSARANASSRQRGHSSTGNPAGAGAGVGAGGNATGGAGVGGAAGVGGGAGAGGAAGTGGANFNTGPQGGFAGGFIPGSGFSGSTAMGMGQDQPRLVATDQGVYVLTGDQVWAFEAGTLRSMGTARVPMGQLSGSDAGGGVGTGVFRSISEPGAGGAGGAGATGDRPGNLPEQQRQGGAAGR